VVVVVPFMLVVMEFIIRLVNITASTHRPVPMLVTTFREPNIAIIPNMKPTMAPSMVMTSRNGTMEKTMPMMPKIRADQAQAVEPLSGWALG
jgi:hypothetical protein